YSIVCSYFLPHNYLFTLLSPQSPPTLFPYTTLFRSLRAGAERIYLFALRDLPQDPAILVEGRAVIQHQRRSGRKPARQPVPHHPDRKSTRLNSSHVKNSYAVFCLKKKISI